MFPTVHLHEARERLTILLKLCIFYGQTFHSTIYVFIPKYQKNLAARAWCCPPPTPQVRHCTDAPLRLLIGAGWPLEHLLSFMSCWAPCPCSVLSSRSGHLWLLYSPLCLAFDKNWGTVTYLWINMHMWHSFTYHSAQHISLISFTNHQNRVPTHCFYIYKQALKHQLLSSIPCFSVILRHVLSIMQAYKRQHLPPTIPKYLFLLGIMPLSTSLWFLPIRIANQDPSLPLYNVSTTRNTSPLLKLSP